MFGKRKPPQPKGQGAAAAKQVTKTVPGLRDTGNHQVQLLLAFHILLPGFRWVFSWNLTPNRWWWRAIWTIQIWRQNLLLLLEIKQEEEPSQRGKVSSHFVFLGKTSVNTWHVGFTGRLSCLREFYISLISQPFLNAPVVNTYLRCTITLDIPYWQREYSPANKIPLQTEVKKAF